VIGIKDMSTPTVTPKLGPTGKPIRRRGRWTYVSHSWNGPVWRLDDTTLDLEYDELSSGACIPGCWILYRNGRYDTPIGHYLDYAMEYVEEKYDAELWKALGGETVLVRFPLRDGEPAG
jgi:hypothetical protein